MWHNKFTRIGCFFLFMGLTACTPRPFSEQSNLPMQSSTTEKPFIHKDVWSTTPSSYPQMIQLGNELRFILPSDNLFLENSPELRDTAEPTLQAVLEKLEDYPHAMITIYGYSDPILPPRLAQALTLRRAQTLQSYFWSHGIPAEQLEVKVCTEESGAIASNKTLAGTAANRRMEVRLSMVSG